MAIDALRGANNPYLRAYNSGLLSFEPMLRSIDAVLLSLSKALALPLVVVVMHYIVGFEPKIHHNNDDGFY